MPPSLSGAPLLAGAPAANPAARFLERVEGDAEVVPAADGIVDVAGEDEKAFDRACSRDRWLRVSGVSGQTQAQSRIAGGADRSRIIAGELRSIAAKVERLWPTREDFRQAWPAVLRGTGLGSVLGVLPGGGALLSAFAAYTVEKKISKTPQRFGRGAIEGVRIR